MASGAPRHLRAGSNAGAADSSAYQGRGGNYMATSASMNDVMGSGETGRHKRNLSLDSRKDLFDSDDRRKGDKICTRNRTESFLELRKTHREKLDQEMNRLLVGLAKLSTKHFDRPGKHSTSQGNPQVNKCAGCGDEFAWSWMRFGAVKNVCELCERYFCTNCACASVQVNLISPTDMTATKEVTACLSCAETLQSYYRQLEFQKNRRVAELDPIVNYQRDTKNMKAQVMELLDQYTEVISALSCIDAGRFAQDMSVLSALLEPPSESSVVATTANLTAATVSVTESMYKSSKYLLGMFMPAKQPPDPTPTHTTSTPAPPLVRSQTFHARSASAQVPTPPRPLVNGSSFIAGEGVQLVNGSPEALYKRAESIEKEIAKSLVTYNRCIKELSELKKESDQETEIIRHVKNSAIDDIQEIALTLKTLRKRLVQIDLRLLEKLYVVLKLLSNELDEFTFSGVLKDPIERCLVVITEEAKNRLENIAEKWEPWLEELEAKVEEVRGEKYLGLPTNASIRLRARRLMDIITHLCGMAQRSIAAPNFPGAVEAMSVLLSDIQEYAER